MGDDTHGGPELVHILGREANGLTAGLSREEDSVLEAGELAAGTLTAASPEAKGARDVLHVLEAVVGHAVAGESSLEHQVMFVQFKALGASQNRADGDDDQAPERQPSEKPGSFVTSLTRPVPGPLVVSFSVLGIVITIVVVVVCVEVTQGPDRRLCALASIVICGSYAGSHCRRWWCDWGDRRRRPRLGSCEVRRHCGRHRGSVAGALMITVVAAVMTMEPHHDEGHNNSGPDPAFLTPGLGLEDDGVLLLL